MIASFSLPAFAKINWALRIAGKREDGYHELCTVFQTVSLNDTLTFEESEELFLTCDIPHVPVDESNLIIKASKDLQKTSGTKKGAKIHLEKQIPSPGGLGGGSSDAAVTLLALNHFWELNMELEKLCEIGARIGSDVPFFLYGGTALGTGRGTEITPLDEATSNFMLIVSPNVDVNTRDAFARLNAPNLTNEASKSILKICHEEAQTLDLWQSDLKNDFEDVVFEIEPEIKRAKQCLLDLGASRALMSGSGASVFGVFENERARQSAMETLESEAEWRIYPVETISRSEYRKLLGPCAKSLSKIR